MFTLVYIPVINFAEIPDNFSEIVPPNSYNSREGFSRNSRDQSTRKLDLADFWRISSERPNQIYKEIFSKLWDEAFKRISWEHFWRISGDQYNKILNLIPILSNSKEILLNNENVSCRIPRNSLWSISKKSSWKVPRVKTGKLFKSVFLRPEVVKNLLVFKNYHLPVQLLRK